MTLSSEELVQVEKGKPFPDGLCAEAEAQLFQGSGRLSATPLLTSSLAVTAGNVAYDSETEAPTLVVGGALDTQQIWAQCFLEIKG